VTLDADLLLHQITKQVSDRLTVQCAFETFGYDRQTGVFDLVDFNGDRGGNSIKVASSNLHSIWDRLLGGSASSADVLRRVGQLKNDKVTLSKVVAHRDSIGAGSDKWLGADVWLYESRELGRRLVYTSEVLEPVVAASRGLVEGVKISKLSDSYLTDAGRVARIRAMQAGYRLAEIVSADLGGGG